ncbi:hypothetical protein RSAG8_08041, partial [Rhizoctonia solani AG-8 WAC10335]
MHLSRVEGQSLHTRRVKRLLLFARSFLVGSCIDL